MNKNINIKKLISLLTLEVRNVCINSVIGYLNSIINEEGDWKYVTNKLIILDLKVLNLIKLNLENKKEVLKDYSKIFNNCYNFINQEFNISFINEAPFNNERVIAIKDFNNYILARQTYLEKFK
jgi:hypothetical protein